ncbi:beta-lactamase family protein [Rhodococcus erythropolis]|jgi:D-alanyl-D-alanine carboxypeptidase|uniref:Peptidase n=1 Tax=Rhodococcus erythropolis TaxID=1833 RepID=A0A5P3GD91_RHOER|nr:MULTISPECIES: serine hydrolase domain-containing protein [Rhodococcus]MCJ0944929.1 beta-lactamase family protein [Rhodococcus sp. ARC_M8]QEX12721.1 beta-lactamase family protein [Rhodococcus erythropolis]QIP41987.1 peptidase [Rhodococcus erythropolis]UKO85157.1 beta-lactamase family protein [Rhodococcus erythropolis]ULD42250.1 beta-lactamase family protein [Rhodococcus qingshengii]
MRSYLLVAAVIIGATTALIGCSTLQRAVEIQSDLDGLTRSGVVGSIATLDDGTTTAVMTSGVPNRTNGDSIGKNDRVRIGSVTKTFTASLVLQLVAEGKVDLDAPIEQYLPGLLHGSDMDGSDMDGSGTDGSAITVRQLLQHRSGLPEFAGEPGADEWIAANEDRTLTPSAAVAIALGKPAQFVPGTSFVYTNTNYIVLGMLVESVTGRSYADELQSRILAPLDLEDTYLPAAGERDIRGDHLTGYQDLDGGLTDVSRTEPSIPWSAGAMVSTGTDLNAFWRALLDGQVVPAEQLAEMTTPQVGATEAEGLGYGMGVGATELPCGVTYTGHSGGIYGYYTLSGATPDRAFTVTLTSTPKDQPDTVAILSHALCP